MTFPHRRIAQCSPFSVEKTNYHRLLPLFSRLVNALPHFFVLRFLVKLLRRCSGIQKMLHGTRSIELLDISIHLPTTRFLQAYQKIGGQFLPPLWSSFYNPGGWEIFNLTGAHRITTATELLLIRIFRLKRGAAVVKMSSFLSGNRLIPPVFSGMFKDRAIS